ncbi:hypothetical protein PsorP6_006535 [Peronosclerospora sorghi]|uniref:Uncharacterized protein n=1 Tax=Peronosclerospora sorghi TaxID=230839 RepID=A0ACC0W0Z3_9STRA|nr:hypothetical protein PsorP6_006535 [Peronosclerospora sorghi]
MACGAIVTDNSGQCARARQILDVRNRIFGTIAAQATAIINTLSCSTAKWLPNLWVCMMNYNWPPTGSQTHAEPAPKQFFPASCVSSQRSRFLCCLTRMKVVFQTLSVDGVRIILATLGDSRRDHLAADNGFILPKGSYLSAGLVRRDTCTSVSVFENNRFTF